MQNLSWIKLILANFRSNVLRENVRKEKKHEEL
jgi:hypothetical protein